MQQQVLIFSCFFAFVFFPVINANAKQDVESIDGRNLDWPTFLDEYILLEEPVILQKAFRNNFAYKYWSSDYIYYHGGAGLYFYNASELSFSLRTVIHFRESFVGLSSIVPMFLRRELTLPKCLDCNLLINQTTRPSWIWTFHVSLCSSVLELCIEWELHAACMRTSIAVNDASLSACCSASVFA
jgi:hypothetical protein